MNKKPTYLTVKDHSVSGEDFQLVYNEELDMLETTPQPSANTLSEYYKSEDYISHTDSKRNWFEKAYHFVRGMALKRKLKLINSFPVSGKTILDVGCGTGDFLQTAKNNSWNVYGIEPNEKARAIANSKTRNQVFDTNTLQEFESGAFDVITLWHVLEHLPNLETEIQNLNRLLKPNGRLVIAVPNFKSYDAKHYNAFWAAYDVPRHLWHFNQTSISNLFGTFNFKLDVIKPMLFDSFYVSLLSEQYKSGSKNLIKAFYIGLRSNFKAIRTKEYSSLIYVLKKV